MGRAVLRAGRKGGGYSGEDFISYEVESEENYSCGQTLTFREKQLTICGKSCRSEGAELLFAYRLASPRWAGQKRLMNEGLCGLSLLGKVVSREGERLKLRLDIDRQHPDQTRENAYPFSWRPPTGNLMYMMPEEGSQVSLYFPSGEEEGAMAVNCIRREEEAKGGHYTERGLKAQGKELKLYPGCMGIESLRGRVLLDDLEGICLEAEGGLLLGAKEGVRIEGKEILVDGGKESLHLYRGRVEIEPGKEPMITRRAELHLLKKPDQALTVSLAEATWIRGDKQEDYGAERFRFKDDPLEESYNHLALFGRVMGGVALVGAATVLSQGLEDSLKGRISSAEAYLKAALQGSVIGALTGAVNVALPKGLSVVGQRLIDFGLGGTEEGLWQLLEQEEFSPERMFKAGLFSVMGGEFARRIEFRLGGGEGGAQMYGI